MKGGGRVVILVITDMAHRVLFLCAAIVSVPRQYHRRYNSN